MNFGARSTAAQQRVERAIEQALGDDGIPAGDNNGELHSGRGKVAFHRNRLAFHRIGPGPEAELETRLRLHGKDARLPVRFSDWREACHGRVSALCAQPRFGSLMHGIERGHLHENIGGRRKLAVDKLEIAERSQERRASTPFLVPAFARSKSQRGKKARQPVIDFGAAGRTKKGDALDHGLILSCGVRRRACQAIRDEMLALGRPKGRPAGSCCDYT